MTTLNFGVTTVPYETEPPPKFSIPPFQAACVGTEHFWSARSNQLWLLSTSGTACVHVQPGRGGETTETSEKFRGKSTLVYTRSPPPPGDPSMRIERHLPWKLAAGLQVKQISTAVAVRNHASVWMLDSERYC
jgi:hypothetical protein